MTTILMATDYSRPMQYLFEHEVQVGSVHSVFRRAMNIAFGDTLLSILSDELPRMPNSVRLPAPQSEHLLARVHPGMAAFVGKMPVSVGAGVDVDEGRGPLRSPSQGIPFRLDAFAPLHGRPEGPHPASSAAPAPTGCRAILSIPVCDCWIALPSIAAWEPRPRLGLLPWQRDRVAQHTDMLARYLAEVAPEEGLATLVGELLLGRASKMTVLAQKALPMLRLLMQAGVERKREDVERAAKGLLGLGPGLTPSGDDVLAGFVAVMVVLSGHLSDDVLPREEIGLWIAALAPSRTTRLSAALLAYAARGEVAEQLGDLLIALATPVEASKVMHAANGLLQFGATSGGDTLLGVLLGLRVLE